MARTKLIQIAHDHGTPCFVYSEDILKKSFEAYVNAFSIANHKKHLICYAVKANSNLSLLKILKEMGSGFDIVSIGELERVLKIGGDPNKIIFSGVGKTDYEIKRALQIGISCFNVESMQELFHLNE